jgi:hypothetical protein
LSPFVLQERDVVKVNFGKILSLINDLFLILGNMPKLAKDFDVIESLLKYGSPNLSSYPFLTDLPQFKYPCEGLHSLLRTIAGRLDAAFQLFESIPISISVQLDLVFRHSAHAPKAIFLFSEIMLREGENEENFFDLHTPVTQIGCRVPFTAGQKNDKQIFSEIPDAKTQLYVRQLPA